METGRSDGAPRARTEGLVVKSLPDELLVYDLARHRAHSLNRVAAAVWRSCNGNHTPGSIGAKVSAQIGQPLDEAVVDYALVQLDRAHLLDTSGVSVDNGPRVRRRDLLRRGAMLAMLPVVASVLAPTPAAAQSCAALNDPCGSGISPFCCPGLSCCIKLGQAVGVCCTGP